MDAADAADADERVVEGVALLDAEIVAADWARRGFEPRRVTMTATTLSLVLRRAPAGATLQVLAAPRPFRDAAGELFTASVAALGSCTWVAASGAPRDAAGAGVTVATIHAPGAPHRVAWAVHLHALGGRTFAELPEVALLSSIAREVVVVPLAGADGAAWAVSLFRDEPAPPLGAPRDAAPRVFVVRDERGERPARDPVDDWMLARMRESGARHAQIAVARGDEVTLARACTFAEEGYPACSLEHALRLGSVSKSLATICLLRAARAGHFHAGLDTPIAPLLALAREPDGIDSVTLRDLLLHRAGLGAFTDMSPTDAANPLSELRVASALGLPRARPGDLRAAISALGAPALRARERATYANEGFTLLGEILAREVAGSFDAFERVLVELFESTGTDARRGALAASSREGSSARGESPAHGSSPTFRRATFDAGDDRLVDLAYATNLAFLGAAAGVSVPVVWVARALARLAPTLPELLSPCVEDLRAGAKATLGFYAGAPGWYSHRPVGGAGRRTFRTVCLHHNGRVEGGASLLMLRVPLEPRPDHPTVAVVVAMNQLGDLYEDPHGRELFGILQRLEEEDR